MVVALRVKIQNKRGNNVKKSHLEWQSFIGLTAPLKKDHQRYINDVTWTGNVGEEFLEVGGGVLTDSVCCLI